MKLYLKIITLWIFAACLPGCQELPVKQPQVVEGNIKSADGVPIHFTMRGTAIPRWCLCIAGLATAVIGRRKWITLPPTIGWLLSI